MQASTNHCSMSSSIAPPVNVQFIHNCPKYFKKEFRVTENDSEDQGVYALLGNNTSPQASLHDYDGLFTTISEHNQ